MGIAVRRHGTPDLEWLFDKDGPWRSDHMTALSDNPAAAWPVTTWEI